MRALLSTLIGGPLLAFSLAPDATEDPGAAIRALLDRQQADWNRGELDAFLSGYWNSPEVVFQSGGDQNRGFAAVRDRYHRRYKAEGRSMGTLAFSSVEVELLGTEAALARGRWRLILPDGQTTGGLFTLVLRKLPEGWRIVHDHTSSETPK
jgi:beta-aspartyl-peptidase (threonine type)